MDDETDGHNGAIFWSPKIPGLDSGGWVYTWYTYCHDYIKSDKLDKVHWCINGVQLADEFSTSQCPIEGKWTPVDVFKSGQDLDTGFLLNTYCLRATQAAPICTRFRFEGNIQVTIDELRNLSIVEIDTFNRRQKRKIRFLKNLMFNHFDHYSENIFEILVENLSRKFKSKI